MSDPSKKITVVKIVVEPASRTLRYGLSDGSTGPITSKCEITEEVAEVVGIAYAPLRRAKDTDKVAARRLSPQLFSIFFEVTQAAAGGQADTTSITRKDPLPKGVYNIFSRHCSLGGDHRLAGSSNSELREATFTWNHEGIEVTAQERAATSGEVRSAAEAFKYLPNAHCADAIKRYGSLWDDANANPTRHGTLAMCAFDLRDVWGHIQSSFVVRLLGATTVPPMTFLFLCTGDAAKPIEALREALMTADVIDRVRECNARIEVRVMRAKDRPAYGGTLVFYDSWDGADATKVPAHLFYTPAFDRTAALSTHAPYLHMDLTSAAPRDGGYAKFEAHLAQEMTRGFAKAWGSAKEALTVPPSQPKARAAAKRGANPGKVTSSKRGPRKRARA